MRVAVLRDSFNSFDQEQRPLDQASTANSTRQCTAWHSRSAYHLVANAALGTLIC